MAKNILKKQVSTIILALIAIFLIKHLYAKDKISTPKSQEMSQANDNVNKEKHIIDNYHPQKVFRVETPFILILFFAFLYGILLGLSPAIYPIIPITTSVIQAHATKAMWYNFLLSITYVLGSAITYATLGLFVALSGRVFGEWLTNPWFILFIIVFCAYLAGAMFGWYEIYMPKSILNKTTTQSNKSFLYTFFAGMISGSVISTYLSPVLAAILLYVATMGNPFLGFLTLFVFAFGMGIILIIVGTSTSALHLVPISPKWAAEIKRIFGFLLLGVCIYFIAPLIKPYQTMLLISGVVLTAAIYYLESGNPRREYLKILIGTILLIVGISLLLEAKNIMEIKSIQIVLS